MIATHVHRVPVSAPSGRSITSFCSHLAHLAVRAGERMAQSLCGLSGHTLVFQFEPGRMSLHCLNCGHQTPGWSVARPGLPARAAR